MYIDRMEFKDKIERLVEELESRNLYFAILRSDRSLRYFTGLKTERNIEDIPILIVTSLGDSALLINRYVSSSMDHYIDELSEVYDIEFWEDHSDYVEKLKYLANKLGLYSRDGLVDDYMLLTHFLEINEIVSPGKVYSFSPTFRKIKRRKRMSEVFKLTRSSEAAIGILEKISDIISPGISEKFLYSQVKALVASEGLEPGFEPIIRFGEHTVKDVHLPTERRFHADDVASVTLAIDYRGYFVPVTYFYVAGDHGLFKDIYDAYTACMGSLVNEAKAGQRISYISNVFDSCATSYRLESIYSIDREKGFGVGTEFREDPIVRNDRSELLLGGEAITIAPMVLVKSKNVLLGFRSAEAIYINDDGVSYIHSPPEDLVVV